MRTPDPPRRRRRALRGASALVIVATLAAVALGAAVALVLIFSGELARERIVLEARKRGVELTYEEASFFWTSASLENVTVRLLGVPGLSVRVGTVDVTLASWEPRRLVASDVQVSLEGSAATLAVALSDWTRRHPGAYQLPMAASGVAVTWRASAPEEPWLTLADGAFAEGGAKIVFRARTARLSGVDLGAVAAAWRVDSGTIAMSFGAEDQAGAPLSLVVQPGAQPPTARLTLAPTDLARLSAPLGVTLPVKGVTAGGHVELILPEGLTQAPIQGRLVAALDGWVPPHPVELDGFVFGNRTTFETDLVLAADASSVTLTKSRVQAGAFVLTGGGSVLRRPDHAVVAMDLSGSLGCAAVAQSAAAAHIGSFLAAVVGTAARTVLEGSVAVRVRIAADTRDLASARVQPTIGVGCGLAPIASLDPKLKKLVPPELLALSDELSRSLPKPGTPLPKLELPTLSDLQKRVLTTPLPTLPSAFPLPLRLPRPEASSGAPR